MHGYRRHVLEVGAAAMHLAALAALLVLAPAVVRAQTAARPQFADESAKQEDIYRSRGAKVPGGYVTGRSLASYAELLPAGFPAALKSLGPTQRWLDIGAGEGQAALDYYAGAAQDAGRARAGDRARVVALSIEDRRTGQWHQRAANLGAHQIEYRYGKRLRDYAPDELGTFQLITDVYGGFTYTENLSRFLENVLSLLEIGGAVYTVLPAVHLEDGTDKLGTWYKTELVDAASRPVKVSAWLKQTTCTKVTCESKADWDEPTQLIKIRKVCSDVSVPPTNLVEYLAGAPPSRRFQLQR